MEETTQEELATNHSAHDKEPLAVKVKQLVSHSPAAERAREVLKQLTEGPKPKT